ncbi:MAG: sensor histidine kinase, partial [Bacteroidota bacterium]
IEKSDFSINKILNELHALFLPQATAKGLKLELLNSHEETTIKSDYTKLIQILTNLINNALKYTEKGKIEFGYENKNDQILFFVKDTGMGISKEQQSKVFDRFYRSDDPRFLIHDGVGLGLSICLGFIEILNGEIWLESEPGKGTNFYFSLPRS